MELRLTRVQVILLAVGTLMLAAAIFAPWFTVLETDGETNPLDGIEFITEAEYYLLYRGVYGTIYSPLVPLLLVVGAVACQVFDVKYAPTLMSSLGLGACVGNLVKLLRYDCDVCGVSDIQVAPGIILAIAGCSAVVAASFLEGKRIEGEGEADGEPAPAEVDTGEDDADAWFEEKDQ